MTFEQKLIEHMGIPVETHDIRIGEHVVHYAKCGKGEPLLLIHGGTFGWGAWYATMPQLARQFTVYAIDVPGSGDSCGVSYAKPDFFENVVGDIKSFIKALNLQGLTVLGHSFGGWVGMRLAADGSNSVRKLILVDSTGFSTHAAFPELLLSVYPLAFCVSKTLLRPRRNNILLEKMLRSAFYNKAIELSEEFLDYFYENMRKSHNLLFVSRLVAARNQLDAKNIYPDIPCPVIIIWGEHDAIMPLREVRSRINDIQHAHIEIVAGAGHVPQLEQQAVFNNRIAQLLSA